MELFPAHFMTGWETFPMKLHQMTGMDPPEGPFWMRNFKIKEQG
jgi:hypothetical protein